MDARRNKFWCDPLQRSTHHDATVFRDNPLCLTLGHHPPHVPFIQTMPGKMICISDPRTHPLRTPISTRQPKLWRLLETDDSSYQRLMSSLSEVDLPRNDRSGRSTRLHFDNNRNSSQSRVRFLRVFSTITIEGLRNSILIPTQLLLYIRAFDQPSRMRSALFG